MKLSTRGRYGTRFMVYLARHYGEGPVLLRKVSEDQEISVKYLEQLVPPLKTVGLVKSTRGPCGGYHLAKLPSEINLYEIIEALETSMALTDCVINPDSCHRSEECAIRGIWVELSQNMTEMLSRLTLEEMVGRQQEIEHAHSLDYQI